MVRRIGHKSRRLGFGSILALLVCGALVFIGYRYFRFFSFPQKITLLEAPEPVIEDHISVDAIRELKRLITATYHGEALEEKTRTVDRDFIGTKTGTLVLSAQVTLRYGIDFSEMKEEDLVQEEDGSITVYLPRVQLFECIVNPSAIKYIYSSHEEIFSKKDQNSLVNEAKDKVIKQARDNRIETKAWEQGKRVITDFFTALGYDKSRINIYRK